MLHWQHKSVRNHIRLWLKLALVSFVGHIVALAMLFFVYKGSMSDMALTVRAAQLNSTIDVVWINQLPANKRQAKGKKGAGKSASPVAARKAKAEGKKSGPKTELKSEVEEKKTAKKGKINTKKEIKKKPEKKKIEEKKKAEIKKPEVIEEKKLIPEPIKKEELIESSVDAQIPNQPMGAEDADLNFEISGSYRDLEALQQFQELQQEISRCWRPPVGIAQTVCCQIKVTFDWEGKVTQMETVKPSGILMFDVSSRNAVAAMEAPKFVRGKAFTITFKP